MSMSSSRALCCFPSLKLFCSVFKKICVHTYRFRIVFARPRHTTTPYPFWKRCYTLSAHAKMSSTHAYFHSRPQRPRSFWSAPRIATSGFTAVKRLGTRVNTRVIYSLPVTFPLHPIKFPRSTAATRAISVLSSIILFKRSFPEFYCLGDSLSDPKICPQRDQRQLSR